MGKTDILKPSKKNKNSDKKKTSENTKIDGKEKINNGKENKKNNSYSPHGIYNSYNGPSTVFNNYEYDNRSDTTIGLW
jgi:hypothetical protein